MVKHASNNVWKITVLKTMVLSQILNVCSTVYVPEYFIK